MEKNNRFILCCVGIFISFFYFGILQEKITRGKYIYQGVNENGEKVIEQEKFVYALPLVLVLCIINYMVSHGALYIWSQKEDKSSKIHNISMSLTYLIAMVSSNMALQWIPYPVQVVGKSAKPIPVMVLGVLIGRKSYPIKKYFFVFLIVIGMVLFMFKDKPTGQIQNDIIFGWGESLLILSLIMDGLTGAVQERIRVESSPSGHQMMKSINGYSAIFLTVAVICTGDAIDFVKFASRHCYIIYNIIALGLTQAIGQLFLFVMVSDFGPLPVSIVTTTRKCFTVLASVVFFGNSLNMRQWLGAAVVFTGLFCDIFFSKGKTISKEKQNKSEKKLLESNKS